MKMFGKKSVSSILFYGSSITYSGYALFILFIIIALVFNQLTIIDTNYFQLSIPFTNSIIKGAYHISNFIAIVSFFLFYTVFFYLLSLIFKTFKAERLFTNRAIIHLKWFTLLNLIFPIFHIIIDSIYNSHLSTDDLIATLLHIGLGVFASFIATIFKLGYRLQEENDLTI